MVGEGGRGKRGRGCDSAPWAKVATLPRVPALPLYDRLLNTSNYIYSIVALLPQEELEEDGAQLSPPGLHAVVLPFADEVREAVSKAPKEEKEEGVEGVNVKTEGEMRRG